MEWCLKLNPQKSEVSAFHLTAKLGHRERDFTFGGEKVRHNPCPTYLGVTLNSSLIYKQYLTKTRSLENVACRDSELGKGFNLYSNWLDIVTGSSGGKKLDIMMCSVSGRKTSGNRPSPSDVEPADLIKVGHCRYRDMMAHMREYRNLPRVWLR